MAAAKESHRIHTFGDALRILRIKSGMSQHQLGSYIGTDKETVKGWERDRLTPSPLYLKKLYDALPRLMYFTEFLPRILRDQLTSRSYATGDTGKSLWVPPSPTPTDLPVPNDLVHLSFGEALIVAMQDENITEHDVASVLEGSLSEIEDWKNNKLVPSDEQYKILLDLFPQLADGPRPGQIEETPPPPAPPIPAPEPPLARIIPIQPVVEPVVVKPVVIEAVPKPQRKLRSKIDIAGAAHANVLLSLQHAKLYLEELKFLVKKTEKEVSDLTDEAKESEKDLLEAVKKSAEELP